MELEQVRLQLKTKDKFAQMYGIFYLWFSIAFQRFLIPHKVKLLQTSVSKGRDVPGQKKILVPESRCPGTRAGANVPGQTPLSRPVPGQNNLKIFKKKGPDFPF